MSLNWISSQYLLVVSSVMENGKETKRLASKLTHITFAATLNCSLFLHLTKCYVLDGFREECELPQRYIIFCINKVARPFATASG